MTWHVPATSTACRLRHLLPRDVVVAEVWNVSDAFPIYPEEARCVATASAHRVREFSAGRYCARIALNELGIRDFPLLLGADRSPSWPDSAIGSITHAADYCGVAVGKREQFVGIGVDAEVVTDVLHTLGATHSDRWRQIFTDEEENFLKALPVHERANMMAVIFSAKEAFYKCQYCVTRQFMDFSAVHIRVSKECFVARLVVQSESSKITPDCVGRFILCRGIVLTALAMTTAESARAPHGRGSLSISREGTQPER